MERTNWSPTPCSLWCNTKHTAWQLFLHILHAGSAVRHSVTRLAKHLSSRSPKWHVLWSETTSIGFGWQERTLKAPCPAFEINGKCFTRKKHKDRIKKSIHCCKSNRHYWNGIRECVKWHTIPSLLHFFLINLSQKHLCLDISCWRWSCHAVKKFIKVNCKCFNVPMQNWAHCRFNQKLFCFGWTNVLF